MKNRNQHLLLNEKQCSLGMYLFGLSTLGEMSNNFTKESNFVENIVEDQGDNMQRDAHDTQKITTLKCNKSHSGTKKLINDKKKEISTVVGLLSVFN